MVWLPDSEKILMICLFVLTEFMNVTHTHTQTPHDNIGRPCIASCGRNLFVTCLLHLVSISVQFSCTVLNLASYTLSFLIICVFRNSLPQVMFCVITE